MRVNILRNTLLLGACFILAGCSGPDGRDRTGEVVGNIVGTATGAVLGSTVGKGTGSIVGAVVGSQVGGMAGSEVGSSFDAPDPHANDAYYEDLKHCCENKVANPPGY